MPNVLKCNPVTEKDDIKSLTMYKLDWDIVWYGVEYQAVVIPGRHHSINGNGKLNETYIYKREYDEEGGPELTFEHIHPFVSTEVVNWAITEKPSFVFRKGYVEHRQNITIYRNDKRFCEATSIAEAEVLIQKFKDHPLELQTYGWAENMIGRKVWWRSQPAIITKWFDGQACVGLEPDTEFIEKFAIPAEFANEPHDPAEDTFIKDVIWTDRIWWHRD